MAKMEFHNTVVVTAIHEGIFRKESWHRPFYVSNGTTDYQLKQIHFYDESGIKFSTLSGWFDWNMKAVIAGKSDTMGITFGEPVKGRKKVDFSRNEVFYLSVGQDWDKTKLAELYIPIRFLDSLGYVVKEESDESESYKKQTKRYVTTPVFDIHIEWQTERDIEAYKAEIIEQISKATNAEQVKQVFENYKNY